MKLEFLAEGSPECPLIRLYAFSQSEATRLGELVRDLAIGDREYMPLHNEAWVESVGECALNLRRGDGNHGVRESHPGVFECLLNAEGWRSVDELVEPFRESDTSGFQWLIHDGKIALLISQSGQW